MELEAVTLGAELAGFCVSQLTTILSSKYFSTDSTATLGCIQFKQRQKMHIANRLTKIHENTNLDNWRYIPGKMNPADHAHEASPQQTPQSCFMNQWSYCANLNIPGILPETAIPNMRNTSDTTSDACNWD